MGGEKGIEDWAVEEAEARGWFVRKLAWLGRKGAQDRIFIKDGRVVFIEFKDRDKGPRPLQDGNRREMIAHGAECHVVNTRLQAAMVLGIPFQKDPLRPHL